MVEAVDHDYPMSPSARWGEKFARKTEAPIEDIEAELSLTEEQVERLKEAVEAGRELTLEEQLLAQVLGWF